MFKEFVAFYLANEYWFAAIQLTLAMVGMGATLRVVDFVDIAKNPKGIVKGLFVQLVMVTLVTFAFIELTDIASGVVIGLALCAAIPGGTTSNIFTHVAKGNTALSVSMTTVSSLACLVTAPLILGVLIARFMPSDFEMPSGQIAQDIFLNLLIPLAAGMWLLKQFPRAAAPFSAWSIRLSLFVILLIVIGASGAGRLDLNAYGMDNAGIILAFILALMVMSWLMPKLIGLPTKDIVAICMEVTVRNINLSLLIHVALFSSSAKSDPMANQALLTVLLYGALQLLMCLPLIAAGRVGAKRLAREEALARA